MLTIAWTVLNDEEEWTKEYPIICENRARVIFNEEIKDHIRSYVIQHYFGVNIVHMKFDSMI